MGYSLCRMADFENALISRIFVFFFEAVFCTEQFLMICRMDFDMFFFYFNFEPK